MSDLTLQAPASRANAAAIHAPPMAIREAHRIERLQVLRAVAACMVVLFHVISNYLPADSVFLRHGLYGLLAGGVDIFFFISGFLIRTTTFRTHGRENVTDYLKKRFARVVPYYWLVTAGLVSLSLFAPGLFRSYQFDWRNALASFLFIPWPRLDGTIYPPLVQGWSLNFELMFYLLFAAMMIFVRRERAVIWLAAIFAVAIVGGALAGAHPERFIMGNPYVLEFIAGAAFADLWRARKGQFPAALAWSCLLLGAFLLALTCIGPWPGRMGVQICGYCCVTLAFLTLPAPGVPRAFAAGLAYLGEASYSIYLIHPIVLSPLAQVFHKSGVIGEQSGVLVVSVSALAIGVSLLAYRFVEVPLLAVSRRVVGLGRGG